MAMTPEERREIEELKTLVQSLLRVENVPFIESAKRRIAVATIEKYNLEEAVSKFAVGNTSGIVETVTDTNGALSTDYIVAKDYNGSITIEDQEGNLYKLGYYNA
jgi:hypothetical protein